MTAQSNDYVTELRKVRAILIVSKLKESADHLALDLIERSNDAVNWNFRRQIGVDDEAWAYVTETLGADPKLVFCHPDILRKHPRTSLYYRGLSGLSLKAAQDYAGAVDSLEQSSKPRPLTVTRAQRIAKAYNKFISGIVNGIDGLDAGGRTPNNNRHYRYYS